MGDINPLIDTDAKVTLNNVYAVMNIIQQLQENNLLDNSHKTQQGLSLLMKCANEALRYEINRIKPKNNNNCKEDAQVYILEA